jgi:hypothetical protein
MRLFHTRIEMIKALVPPGGVYAEVGVFEGTFSKKLQEELSPTTLYMIDLFEGICCSGDQDGNNVVNRDLNNEHEKLLVYASQHPSIQIIKGKSYEFLATLPDNSLDMIYVDGDHSYEGCMKDLIVAYSKVKSGGWIMGHDYEMNKMKARNHYDFGVRQAADEFCKTYNQTIAAKGLDGCVSFGIQLSK